MPAVAVAVALAGTPVSAHDLTELGFQPLQIHPEPGTVVLRDGRIGVRWNVVGEVPESAGLYAFTIGDTKDLRVVYVGMTTHLWMVTKGRLPDGGGGRGGQQYGRPLHAGATRRRVNVLVAAELAAGHQVHHWVRALPLAATDALRREESRLIGQWKLREHGWNRA